MSIKLPKTMKAAHRVPPSRPGEQDYQIITDTPLPKLSHSLPDEHVLVNVHYTALNPIDLKFPESPIISRFLPTTIPCLDFAGIVIDSKSSHFKSGEAVFGQTEPLNFAACAEYVVVGAQHCAKIPQKVKLEAASTIGIAGLMAYQSIVPYVKANDRVFINGGSGGVGTYGIQIAKAMGCSVVVACSEANAELCKRLGAEETIDYRLHNIPEALEKSNAGQFDLVVDNVFSDPNIYWSCHRFLRPKGRYMTTAISPNLSFAGNMLKIFLWPAILGGGQRSFSIAARKSSTSDYDHIAAWVQEGTVKPVIEHVYAIEDIGEAFERLRTGRTRGKLVVKINDSVQKEGN